MKRYFILIYDFKENIYTFPLFGKEYPCILDWENEEEFFSNFYKNYSDIRFSFKNEYHTSWKEQVNYSISFDPIKFPIYFECDESIKNTKKLFKEIKRAMNYIEKIRTLKEIIS